MQRRQFFAYSLMGLGSVAAAGIGYSAYRYMSPGELPSPAPASGPGLDQAPAGAPANAGAITSVELGVESIPVGEARLVAVGATPVIVVHRDNGFVAFNATCAHLGCLVKWDPEQKMFVCPCHAGQYDQDGKVISGPPPTALRKCPVETKGDKLLVKAT